ncbi:MAG: four helix bundle protein [Candidatus Curtissbacteria bacterium]
MKINSFEDLLVWQKARELVTIIYESTEKFPKREQFSLVDQIRRSTTSIPANIAEGFSRFHLSETIMFYRNARGSLSELKSHLYISFDLKYLAKNDLDSCIGKIDEIGKMLNGLINATNSFRNKSKL